MKNCIDCLTNKLDNKERQINITKKYIKYTIEYIKKIALEKNIRCLDNIYINLITHMNFECINCLRKYNFTSGYLISNRFFGCSFCNGNGMRVSQDKVNELIISRGGTLYSTYVNNRIKLDIKCYFGHNFSMNWSNLQQGGWCKECSRSISERICRKYFETIFNDSFPSVRPEFLLSPKNYKLELDGFSEKLGIAFEHNGEQHYKKIFYHTQEQFEYLVNNDNYKIKKCKEKNIKLIIIPELFTMIKLDNLKDYIKQECIKQNINIPDNFDMINIDINKIYYEGSVTKNGGKLQNNKCKYTIEDIQNIINNHNGKCLSEYYSRKMTFMCEYGHIWQNTPYSIINNIWCPICFPRYKSKYNIQYAQKLAEKYGGICLSENVSNYTDILTWKCKNDHIFKVVFKNVNLYGRWCPLCKKLEKFKSTALI